MTSLKSFMMTSLFVLTASHSVLGFADNKDEQQDASLYIQVAEQQPGFIYSDQLSISIL